MNPSPQVVQQISLPTKARTTLEHAAQCLREGPHPLDSVGKINNGTAGSVPFYEVLPQVHDLLTQPQYRTLRDPSKLLYVAIVKIHSLIGSALPPGYKKHVALGEYMDDRVMVYRIPGRQLDHTEPIHIPQLLSNLKMTDTYQNNPNFPTHIGALISLYWLTRKI